MWWFFKKRKSGQYLLKLVSYLDSLAKQKNDLTLVLVIGDKINKETKILKNILAIIEDQAKYLNEFSKELDGRIKPHLNFKEVLKNLSLNAESSSDEYTKNYVKEVLQTLVLNDLIEEVNYIYKKTICPVTLQEHAIENISFKDCSEEIEKHGIEKSVINNYRTNLLKQRAFLSHILGNIKKGSLKEKAASQIKYGEAENALSLFKNLSMEENSLRVMLASDEAVISGILTNIEQNIGKLEEIKVVKASRLKAAIKLLFGLALPASVIVAIAIGFTKPTKFTRKEFETIYKTYVGKSIGEIVSQLKIEDLPDDIKEEIEKKLVEKSKESAVGEVEFDKMVDIALDMYSEAVLRILEQAYEEEIEKAQKEGKDVKIIGQIDNKKEKIKEILTYYKPTILEHMKEIRAKEGWIDWLKRTGGNPITWSNQVEQNFRRYVENELQKFAGDVHRNIKNKIKENIFGDLIKEKDERVIETKVEIAVNEIVDYAMSLIYALVLLTVLSFIPIRLNVLKHARRACWKYLKEGYSKDFLILIKGFKAVKQ